MNDTLRRLELTQESHQLLEDLNNLTINRYYEVKRALTKLASNQTFKPFFKYPIQ